MSDRPVTSGDSGDAARRSVPPSPSDVPPQGQRPPYVAPPEPAQQQPFSQQPTLMSPQGFGPAPAAFQPPQSGQQQPGSQGFGPPAWSPLGGPAQGAPEPDWSALATQNEQRMKRRRKLLIGGAVVAVLAVGGGIGAVLMNQGGKPKPVVAGPSQSGSVSGSAVPSASSAAPSSRSSTHASATEPATVGTLAATVGTTPLGLGKDAVAETVPGNTGKALSLPSGQNSFASTSAPVVDATKSFTLSARALVDLPSGNRTVVSQGSGAFYTFSLGRVLVNGANHWIFKVQVPGGGSKSVLSKGPAAADQWTVLTGAFDASQHRIELYVNGTLQASTAVPGIQQSTGGLQIGRDRSNSAWVDPWHGAVADIELWNRPLTAAEVVQVAAGASKGSGKDVPAPTAGWLTG